MRVNVTITGSFLWSPLKTSSPFIGGSGLLWWCKNRKEGTNRGNVSMGKTFLFTGFLKTFYTEIIVTSQAIIIVRNNPKRSLYTSPSSPKGDSLQNIGQHRHQEVNTHGTHGSHSPFEDWACNICKFFANLLPWVSVSRCLPVTLGDLLRSHLKGEWRHL